MKNYRIDKKPSITAMWTAFFRAYSASEKDLEFKGDDNLARLFISPVSRFLLGLNFYRREFRKKVPHGAYEYLVARTIHYDQLFKKGLDENIPQIVFLGAGFDTRAYRFQERIQQTNIFELDAPQTQEKKQKKLKKAKIPIPGQLTFVPVNFAKQGLGDVLLNTGYDSTLKTLFIWEGVTMYLFEDAVKKTLRFIYNHSGDGSMVAFDYFYKSVVEGTTDLYGAKEQYEVLSKFGEPLQFGLENGQIEAFGTDLCFELLSHYTPDEFEKQYLHYADGTLYGKMYRCACNAVLKKAPQAA